jgi:hypothetical protein
MTIPAPPWWLRILNGGNPQSYAVAGIAFVMGYLIGKGDRQHWKDVARSNDHNWHKEHGWHNSNHDGHEHKHTDRERERDHHKHGEGYGR